MPFTPLQLAALLLLANAVAAEATTTATPSVWEAEDTPPPSWTAPRGTSSLPSPPGAPVGTQEPGPPCAVSTPAQRTPQASTVDRRECEPHTMT
uniref:Uncharacterized protein n=1 Tax=Rhipicephalus appendiculatus TaxID=34631 RepID=A0A131Z530_RHIAP